MDDKKKQQPNTQDETQHSYFEDTVGMTGPVIINEQINEQQGPEMQSTEGGDDVSVIKVKHEDTSSNTEDSE